MSLDVEAAPSTSGGGFVDPGDRVRFCVCCSVKRGNRTCARLCVASIVVAAIAMVVVAGLFLKGGVSGSCETTIPTSAGPNTVTLTFYSNDQGGHEGDACPVACSAGNKVMTQLYAVYNASAAGAAASPQCLSWPGHSGKNAMKQGSCNVPTGEYAYDQWTNCDCTGTVGAHKVVSTTQCRVDKPPSLCSMITDYSGCQ